MLLARDVTGARIRATRGARGSCPSCEAPLIPKCGELVSHHWAHQAEHDCDSWAEPESEWHRSWKARFPIDWAEVVIQGKLSKLERKTSEPIAYLAGHERKPVQHFVGAGRWDDEGVMAELRRHVAEELAEAEAVLVLDPSAFPKSGADSCAAGGDPHRGPGVADLVHAVQRGGGGAPGPGGAGARSQCLQA